MDLTEVEQQFICPITYALFNDPVLADDGITYERDAIEDWLSNNSTSPITGKMISNTLVGCILIKNIVDNLIKTHPELKEQQYVISNMVHIERLIKSGNFAGLLKCTNFDLKYIMDKKMLKRLTTQCDIQILKHIIDNSIDLECQTIKNWRPIHSICRHSTPEMIKYIIDKGVDLECQHNEDWRPIHLICRYSTPEMIKYIVDKGVDLECQNNEDWRPIHLICRHSTPEMIKYIIDKGVDLEYQHNEGWRPIHYICRYSTPEMIKYIIDKGVDLECQDNEDWRPIHLICRYSTPEIIKYIIDKGVNLNHHITKYAGKDANYSFMNLIVLNNNIESNTRNALINHYKNVQKQYMDPIPTAPTLDELLNNHQDIQKQSIDPISTAPTSIWKRLFLKSK